MVNRASDMDDRPASGEMSMRATGMKRPTSTALPPWRFMKPRVRSRTAGLTLRECFSKKSPPRRPSRKATVVPAVDAIVEMIPITSTDSRPCAANAAAVTSVVSVGKGIAIPSAKMNSATIQ